MKLACVISGPFSCNNLSLLSGSSPVEAPYATLEEVLGGGRIVVHETGHVNQLEINTADMYAHRALFRKLWRKLLESAAAAALASRHLQAKPALAPEALRAWMEALAAAAAEERLITDRIRIRTRRLAGAVRTDTKDRIHPENPVHVSHLGA